VHEETSSHCTGTIQTTRTLDIVWYPEGRKTVSYESMVTIVLSVLTIAITSLGVVIALAAAWGFRSIKHEAVKSAEMAVRESLCEYVGGQELQQYLRREVKARLEEESDRLFRDFALVTAFSRRSNRPDAEVGKPYPEYEDDSDAVS
jgi:hypothetical protein